MLLVGFVALDPSFSPLFFPSKCRQKLCLFCKIRSILFALVPVIPFSITLLHVAVSDGVGKLTLSSAKLVQILEACLVDNENFETRPDADLALSHFGFGA